MDLMLNLMQNIMAEPIDFSFMEQTVPDDPLPAVKIQFYRISSYAVSVVDVISIAIVCHILFLLFMTIYATYFKHEKRATRFWGDSHN